MKSINNVPKIRIHMHLIYTYAKWFTIFWAKKKIENKV